MEVKLKGLAPCNQVKTCFLKNNNQSVKGAGGVKVASKIDKTFRPVDFSSSEPVQENVIYLFPAPGIGVRGVSFTLSRS